MAEDWRAVPCKVWTGSTVRGGYGNRRRNGRHVYVHRDAWEQVNGPIPEGMKVLHRCDNPPCYEERHLFLGTQLDNIRDRDAKGRASHRGNPKTTAAQRVTIAQRYRAGESARALGLEFGLHPTRVWQIAKGK